MKKNAIYNIPRNVYRETFDYEENMVQENICILNQRIMVKQYLIEW